jgi:signal transduction histidine kinase
VRWFGVVLGAYVISQTNSGNPKIFPPASQTRISTGYVIMGALALANLAIWRATSRATTAGEMRTIGVAAFTVDSAILLGLTWLFSYDPRDNTWVVLYILPLEGAMRWQLGGALTAVFVSLASELGREAYLASVFRSEGYLFQFSNLAFRVGVEAIVALVAGFMARSLAKEADYAAEQARRFQEAARRESEARRELAAFNTAILTGVAAEDLNTSIQLMAEAIGPDLGFETFSILLREGDGLVVKGMYGMPFYEDRVPIGTGITGKVAEIGQPLLVPDVSKFPGYIEVDATIRSEMAAPMRIGDLLVGVVDVESRVAGAFDEAALALLGRLADQIALVAHSNQLLSRQRETMERLRELDQMKSDFVAITSHELRTPITAIRGFVKTLLRNQDRLTPEQVASFMSIIDRQSGRLARLVEDLLMVARIEAGTVRLSMEEVDLQRFLRESVESLGPESRARIHVDVQDDAGSVLIDPDRVDQVLRNLVENALKFSPDHSQVLVAAALANSSLQLSVTDQGSGIPAEALPYIFERFHQAGEVMTREAEGAGLGLYITKRLIEAMGGTIDVESTVGLGSTFRVVLPKDGTTGAPTQDLLEAEAAPEHRELTAESSLP